MVPLFKKLWFALWFDEVAAKRWLVGLMTWLGSIATNVLAYPWEDVKTWDYYQWSFRCAAAGALAIGVMIATGQKNHSEDQIRSIAGSSPAPPLGP